MKKLVLLLLVALPLFGQRSRDTQGDMRPAKSVLVVDSPYWPSAGVSVRASLVMAGAKCAQGYDATMDTTIPCDPPIATSWRFTVTVPEDLGALLNDPAWLAENPRYANGKFDVPIWKLRGGYCRAATISVPAVAKANVSLDLDSSNVKGDDYFIIESWAAYGFVAQVSLVEKPWLLVSAARLVGTSNAGHKLMTAGFCQ